MGSGVRGQHHRCLVSPPAVRRPDEPLVIDDIAYSGEGERNADACTSRGCMWAKSSDGKVYVPYVIASHYCKHRILLEKSVIFTFIHSYKNNQFSVYFQTPVGAV